MDHRGKGYIMCSVLTYFWSDKALAPSTDGLLQLVTLQGRIDECECECESNTSLHGQHDGPCSVPHFVSLKPLMIL